MSKKLTPNVRFKGFSDDWEQRNLKNSLSLLKDGTHGSHKDGNYSMLLSTKNLVGGKVVFDKMIDRKIGKEDYQSIFKGYTLQSEDILLSVVGSIGRVSVYQPVDVPIAFQRSVAILRSKGQLIQGFLRYSLETYKIQHQMKMKTTISAQPDLFLGDLGQITITFPNIKTQVKITKILNNITETIASNQKQLDQLKTLKKLFLQKIFDQEWRFKGFTDPWEQRKLVSMAKITTGKAFKSEDFSDEGRYLVITNKDILKVNTNCISGDRIDIDDSKIIDKYSLANPSVLITMDGVNIGKTGRYQNKFAVLAQRVGRLESDELNFVYQITQNDRFINTMKTLSVGNAIKHISLKQISEYVLSVPLEDSEKRRIGNLLTGLDQTITSNQKQLDQLKQLKKWFLQNLFV